MKSTGIVRSIDSMGRFVIPMELRKTMHITDKKDSLEVFVDEDKIILRKYTPTCIFCQNYEDVIDYNGHKICRSCIKKLYDEAVADGE
ncbi:MAG: AbrB/MazE/SpoVT family DNA-binding domain-containing protein [Clostridiales bacterium]|nr:AbrB/MazE/SpoVT family DNA-binding domain-containing protein [Clostridiales bacterium]MCD7827174.1 AbrB/MazE/SpoVT family DNA-binding domain-containing protein [Clostridiales bacterium]